MNRRCAFAALMLIACLTGAAAALAASGDDLIVISTSSAEAAKRSGANCHVRSVDGSSWLRIEPDGAGDKCEVAFSPSNGEWNLSARESVVIDFRNPGGEPLTARARIENTDAQGLMNSCRAAVVLLPGEHRTLTVRVTRTPEDPGYAPFKPFYMYFKNINVRDNTVDASKVARLVISIDKPKSGAAIEVSSIRAEGSRDTGKPVAFLPFVDKYGQYVHGDWPGKIYSDADFSARREEESKERRDWPGPKDWNQYGGWAAGPTLKATGFFYATKHEGKWWLVDPEGRLYWSYGPTGVGFGGDVSPITDRENWFAELPPRDSELGRFYRNGRNATYMYYKEREWLGFDMQRADLARKYGDDYEQQVASLSHERLRSWGFNTLGNWSDSKVRQMRKTPYVVPIHYDAEMMHYRMPDIYHPEWENSVKARMERERDTTAGDPWNIGYFIDNERWFGWRPRAAAIGEEALKNPRERHVKVKFIEMLKSKYPTIDALSEAWATTHASWEALAEHRAAPDMKNAKVLADCGDFGMMFAERYFTVCRDAVKAVAPNNMYLGSRFHGHIDAEVVKLASKYADVVSYNVYDNPPEKRVNQYNKLDVPIMSTEWGIGSDPQQTPFRGENLKVPTPAERAREMASYTEHALRHPSMVGAHFFQFRDQPLSGRPDGEATLRGFVNIADTPSFELIQANRAVAYDMYQRRAAAK